MSQRDDNGGRDEPLHPALLPNHKPRHKRPSKSEPMVPIGTVLHQKYKLLEIVGAGGYGQIFKAYWTEKKIHVAVKIMSKYHESQRMILEQQILLKLQEKAHFPFLFASGSLPERYLFICMELLGNSLSDLRKRSPGKRFELVTAIRVGLQGVEALKLLHEAGYIHRDLKPGNMCCGNAPSTYRTIYLVDFGLSRKYKSDGRVMKRKSAGFRGTLRYVSLNVHMRKDQCPMDDLISLFYAIIELSEGTLPWTRFREPDDIAIRKKVCKAPELCKQQPEELFDYYTTCLEAEDPDWPQYDDMTACLKKCLPEGAVSLETAMSYETIMATQMLTVEQTEDEQAE